MIANGRPLCAIQNSTAVTATVHCGMTIQRTKTLLGALWVLAALTLALAGDGLTFTRAMLFVGLGLVPPLVMLVLWNPPTQTLSESIDAARR